MNATVIIVCGLMFQPAGTEAEAENPRLAFLLAEADELKVNATDAQGGPVEVARRTEPLLRFTNPLYEAQADGALLLWVHDQRPVFLASYSIRNEKEVFRELSIVAHVSIVCQREGQVVWSPAAASYQPQAFRDAPKPAANERLRLIQMRNLLRRFQVGTMRFMPNPLYRYSATKQGVLDGALFAFTDTNDPELIVSISAVKAGDEPAHWEYGLCRMNSSRQTMLFDDEPVWSVEGYWDGERSASDPYAEQWNANLPEELKLTAEK